MKVILGGAADCTEIIREVEKHLNSIGIETILCEKEDFVLEAAEKIAADESKKAVFFSKTGLDVWVKAGRTPGLCAAVCHNTISAEEIRKEKSVNTLCIGVNINELKIIISIIDIWLITDI